jgi:uncharacterized protein YxjI
MSTLSSHSREDVLAAIESADRFVIQQVFKPLANEYRISVPASGSSDEGQPLLFVKQKKMKIKEDIRFRLDPDRDEHLFMIKSKSVFEFAGRHDVLAADGSSIGMLEKSFGKSLLRSHWHVHGQDGAGEQFDAQEKSLLIAIIRRAAGIVSDGLIALLQWLPFDFVLRRNGEEIGHYRRVLGQFRDRYVLELGPGSEGIDRRLLLAFAVALDALQDR